MMKNLWVLFALLWSFNSSASIDKTVYFAAFSSNDLVKIKAERVRIEKMNTSSEKKAYLGAILMKESQFLSSAKEKLAQFNKGKVLLEAEITANQSVVEYRFLRLMIQENCPKILKYTSKIQEDSRIVAKEFAKQTGSVKSIILIYSKSSPALPTSKLTS